MAHLVFFEKPGCGGNAKQRALLEAAGHTLDRRNLLTAHWTRERLLEYLAALPVAQWFNRAAPRVKSGEVQPEQLDADSALALLLAEPLLIRRPLMQRTDNDARLVGFGYFSFAFHACLFLLGQLFLNLARGLLLIHRVGQTLGLRIHAQLQVGSLLFKRLAGIANFLGILEQGFP